IIWSESDQFFKNATNTTILAFNALVTISLWNSLEVIFIIFFTFKRYLLAYGSSSATTLKAFTNSINIIESIQVTGFDIQEFIISIIYIREIARLAKIIIHFKTLVYNIKIKLELAVLRKMVDFIGGRNTLYSEEDRGLPTSL
ncbi:hypothetical protein BKA65DRAFT_487961, partial [Rhexocercosporidium sp. MPI-PUGE-AT-0058]